MKYLCRCGQLGIVEIQARNKYPCWWCYLGKAGYMAKFSDEKYQEMKKNQTVINEK